MSIRLAWCALLLALLLATASGCPGEVPVTCSGFRPFSGAPSAPVMILDDRGSPWTDMGDVSMDLGGQGGFMVQPTFALDPSLFGTPTPDQICARILIDNIDPTGGDRFTGFETLTLDVPFRRNVVTGRLETAVIFNQLRWSPLPPGTGFRMTVVVRTAELAATTTLDLLLQPGR